MALASVRDAHGQAPFPPVPPDGFDRVILSNGNILDGEVKSMSRGKLAFDTDAMNIVSVDWDDIAYVSSSHVFEVTDISGRLHYGEVTFADRERVLVVRLGDESVNLPFAVVVELRNLADGFWAKTAGYVDVGINVVRANKLRSLLLDGQFGYNGRIWELDLNGETYFQSQSTTDDGTGAVDVDETSRSSLSLEGRRNISGTWAATTSAQTEANEELSLERRVLFSAGARYNIVRNQALEFYTGASAVFNAERFTGQDRTGTGEGKFTLGFDMFDLGDVDVYVLTETFVTRRFERYRTNIDGRVAWEVVDDFTIGLSVVERFDSKPANGAARRDYQYGFTVGWTWG